MDGIIVIDKPAGLTSFDVIRKLRRILRMKKMGHSGTLDPMATGVLVILLGSATKLASRFLNGDKGYIGEMTLGITTDSLDAQGTKLKSIPVNSDVSEKQIAEAFKKFSGAIEQIPPMVSAKHHKGERLYELARKGITVDRQPVSGTVHELSLKKFTPGEYPRAEFYCKCSKGVYIRSLAADIGDLLGFGAHLSSLRRVYSQPFSIDQARTLDEIEALIKAGGIDKIVLDPGKIGI